MKVVLGTKFHMLPIMNYFDDWCIHNVHVQMKHTRLKKLMGQILWHVWSKINNTVG